MTTIEAQRMVMNARKYLWEQCQAGVYEDSEYRFAWQILFAAENALSSAYLDPHYQRLLGMELAR